MSEQRDTPILPPDLRTIEQLLTAPPPPAPAVLLARITASRVAGATRHSSPFADTTGNRRWARTSSWWGAAVAASIAFIAASQWAQPVWIGRAADRPGIAKPAPSEPTRLNRLRGSDATDDLARMLSPWPTSADAQLPRDIDRRYPLRASLLPRAVGRLQIERRTYGHVVRDADGRTIERSDVEWQLDTLQSSDGTPFWLLSASTSWSPDSPIRTVTDSMLFWPQTLEPTRRALHRGTGARHFLFVPSRRYLLVADTRGALTYDAPSAPWLPKPGDRFWMAPPRATPRRLAGRHTLVVSEAHLAFLLRTVPLWVGWESTAAIPSPLDYIAPRYDERVMGLRAVAIDTLATPRGRTPCYRVELDYGAHPDLWWISVATGEFIRGVRTLSDPTRTEVTTLESVGPLPPRPRR